jgi:hypothetical protein
MAVVPETVTEWPNWSPGAPSLAVSSCCWVHVVPDCTNTYAAPCDAFAPTVWACAPTMAVGPERETEAPKWSFAAPSLAVSSCCWVHVVPDCANTYAAP